MTKKVEVDVEFVQALIDYLVQRPYRESYQFINYLASLEKANGMD